MNGIEKQAEFYRDYLPDDRSLAALTVILSTTVALLLLVYLMGVAAETSQGAVSFDPQRSSCSLEIGLQKKNRNDWSVVLGWSGRRRVASAEDASPVTE
jgi:hypothetical protein